MVQRAALEGGFEIVVRLSDPELHAGSVLESLHYFLFDVLKRLFLLLLRYCGNALLLALMLLTLESAEEVEAGAEGVSLELRAVVALASSSANASSFWKWGMMYMSASLE